MKWSTLIALAATMACAGSAGGTSGVRQAEGCAPVPEDLWIDGRRVYRDCSVERPAKVLSTPRLQYTPTGRQSCVRASIEVVVDTTGRAVLSSARTVRSNDPQFLQAVVANVVGFRFEPAVLGGIKVRQIIRLEQAAATRVVVVSAGGSATGANRPPRAPPC